MHRVHFTSHDIRNARVGASYGPLAETAFSFDHLYRRAQGLRFDGWRSRVRPALGATARDLAGLLPRSLDLVMVTGPATCLDEGLAAFASASPAVIDLELGATAAAGVVAPRWAPRLAERDPGGRAVVAGALAEYYRRAIDPFWPRVSALLERERARAAGLLGERGLDHLLASLHPTIGWDPPVLTIDDGDPAIAHDCYLDGRGVVFVPSLFCRYGYPMSTDAGDPDAVPVIHYPVEPGLDLLDRLWAAGDESGGGRAALASLLGATRAVVLDAIAAGPCTTSELARRSATSLPTASQHASVLRDAGLISTRRVGRAVLHSLTSVGAGLLTDCR